MMFTDRFLERTLKKQGLRSDRFWIWNGLVRRFLRGIPFFLDTRALLASQYWPRERIESLQRERLAELLNTAVTLPFWRDRIAQTDIDPEASIEALQHVSVISKRELLDVPQQVLVNEHYMRISYRDRTSGSTGRPFSFLMDMGYAMRSYAICERMFRAATDGLRYPVVSVRAREREGFAFLNYRFFFIRGYNAVRHRFPQFLETISEYRKGFLLYGFVSPLLEFARVAEEQDVRLPIRAVIASGEELRDASRTAISEGLHANVYSCYTAQEVGWMAFECASHRLHINEESVFVEVVDTDDSRIVDGTEGRIVVTPLDHRVMPLIRYYTGDVGRIDPEPCPCGRTLRTIRIKGREAHLIPLTDDRSIPLLELASIFDRYTGAVQQYQILHIAPLAFTMRIVAGPEFEKRSKDLREALVHILHPSVQLSFEIVEAIEAAPSSKAIYYVRSF